MSNKEIERILLRLKILEKENEKLKEENAYLKFELEELKSKRYKSNKKKPPDNPPPNPSSKKKRGGLFGHKCKNVSEHITEDLIPPRIEVTLRRKHHY